MSATDFTAFLMHMGWSDAEARRRLGVGSHHTIAKFKREGGPKWLSLACAWLDSPFGGQLTMNRKQVNG